MESSRDDLVPVKRNADSFKNDHVPAQRNVDESNNDHVPAQRNVDGTNNAHVPAQRNVDGSDNDLVSAQRNVDGSNNDPVPAPRNVDGSNNDHVPAQRNVDDSNNDPVPTQRNVDESNNDHVPAPRNVDGTNNDHVPAQRNMDGSDNDLVPAQRNVDGSNNGPIPVQRNVDGTNNDHVPAQRNVDGSNNDLVSAQRNVGGSNNDVVPAQRNVGGSVDELVLADLDHQMQAMLSAGQQSASGGQSSRSISVVNSKNVSISTRQSIPGALAQETLKLRLNEAKKTFVSTDSYKQVQRKLDQFNHVTICGASGEGKTTMALMLARGYLENGYEVVFVEKIDVFDFNECISSTQRLVLILDDIFGTVGLSTDISHLRNLLNSLKTHLDDSRQMSSKDLTSRDRRKTNDQDEKEQEQKKDIRVVFTSKTYNFKDGFSELKYQRYTIFTGSTVVDLTTDKDYRYSKDEKIAIYKQYKTIHPGGKENEISEEDLLNLDTSLFGFPLTCRLFSEFEAFRVDAKEFFKHPLFYLRLELNVIMNHNNNKTAALILMLLCGDKMELTKLERRGNDPMMDEIFEHVKEFVPSATSSGVARAARSFRRTFFTGGDTLSFSHSAMYDACACALYELDPSFVLQFCSYDFMYERLKPGSVEETKITDHLNFIFVSEDYHDLIASRLIDGMKHGKFTKTVTHPILKNEQFVLILLHKLQAEASPVGLGDTHWIQQKDKERGFLYWAVQGYSPLLVERIETLINVCFTQSDISEALEGCVEKDNLRLLKKLFLRLGKDLQFITKNKLLLLSAETGSWKMAEYLLEQGADIKTSNEMKKNYIHLLCLFGKSEILRALLRQDSVNKQRETLATINSVDTPLMTATMCGSDVCFHVLSDVSKHDVQNINGCSVIHLASLGGNLDIVQHVLTPSNINSREVNGWTPVMIAAESGNLSVFNFLVSKNADLTMVSDSGDSLLHLACQGGNRDIEQHVLTPSNINSRGQHGYTPVMMAAVRGQLSVFDFLVSKNADLTMVSDSGDSLLHLACQGGNRDIVQLVLTPSNINSRGQHGYTPVMMAALGGQLSVFDFLVSKNADLTMVSDSGDSLLHLACQGGNRDIVQLVLTASNINSRGKNGCTPVMKAAVSGQQSVFDFLVSKNADLMLVSDYGDSLLHLACQGGNRDIVQLVLTPSNINSRGQHGCTPVMKAAVIGQQSVFDFLVSQKADLMLVDDYGDSLLHLACQGGNRDIVQHVLTPSNINRRGQHGCTPVMKAAVIGQQSVFDFLVSKNADLMLVSDYGDSLLHLACQGGNRDIVQHALTTSNINSRGQHGMTPIMAASYRGYGNIIDLLVENQVDLSLTDTYGRNVVRYAIEGGKADVADYLKSLEL